MPKSFLRRALGGLWIASFVAAAPGGAAGGPPASGQVAVEAPRPPGESASADEGGQVYMRGMWASLAELQSGEVEIREVKTDRGRKSDSTIYYAFDRLRSRVRFDRRDGGVVSQSVKNDQYTAVFQDRHVGSALPKLVSKYLPDQPIRLITVQAFDLQLVGIGHWTSFEQAYPVSEFRSRFRVFRTPADRVERDGDRVTLFWTVPMGDGLFDDVTVVLDGSIGYRPVGTGSFGRRADWKEPALNAWSETRWTKVDDVYVPKYWHFKGPKDLNIDAELTFDWKQVNRPVPDRVFTIEGMGLPNGTEIVNRKTGRAIIEGKIGDEVAAAAPSTGRDLVREGSAKRLRWVLAANGAILLAVGAALVRRRMRRG